MSPPTGRRAALRGLAAAAAFATASVRPVEAMAAAPGPHPGDAAVFAACAAVQRAQEALLAIDQGMSTIDWSTPAWAAAKRLHDSAWKAREAAYDELCGLRPLTLAGHAARASAAVLAGAGCRGDGPQTVVELLDAELVLTVLDGLAALPAAATSAAGAIGVASSSPAAADAELMRLCAAFDRIERQIQHLFASVPDEAARDRALAPIEARRAPLLDAIVAARATTAEGHAARAATLVGFAPELVWKLTHPQPQDGPLAWDQCLLAAVLRDLAPQAVPHRPPARPGHTGGGAPGATLARSA